jgi:pyruvate/2-oxoglutarate dehydrogenase complex dihydrolipoamide dehydrogenase (E3) component
MGTEVQPLDKYNEELVSNVHPPDWKNPEPTGTYNLVVIGAGTAGLVTAAGAATLGAKVAIVEKALMGGDCLNVGCVPSKCIIRSSRVYKDIQDAADYGIKVPEGAEVDFGAVMERMRRLRAGISHHDSAKRFTGLGVDVFLGQGKFTGHSTVEVDGKTLQFKKAVIATGARAFEPPIKGLTEAGFLTNETVFNLTQRPGHIAVFGAGPLGCELAQTFCRLGSKVTIIEMGPQFLSREDPDAARILYESFKKDGVDVRLSTKVVEVKKKDHGKYICVQTNGKTEEILVDEILVGAGRVPNVDTLNLEAAGVEYNRYGVKVDDYLRTTNRKIYAAGDICLMYKFTHTADATARIVIQNALFGGKKKLSALTIPWCTYTDPEIAHVGMYEKDAKAKGMQVQTIKVSLKEVDRAVVDGEEKGFIKVNLKKGTDKILGATIVARHAGEMISEITVAIANNLGLLKIAKAIHPYPTQAEAIKRVADTYNATRLTPKVKKMFSKWFAWRR